ncbi:TonB-dependent receptor [Francisellaceae bacterium]|nr:TonB-dependent receptor [Francisellaceae bacterium]
MNIKPLIYRFSALYIMLSGFSYAQLESSDDEDVTYTLPTLVFKTDETKQEQTPSINRYQSLPISQGGVDYSVNQGLIKNSASQAVSSSINNLSGVQDYNNTGSNPVFYIRGQRANITINGIPINQFDSSAQNLNLIPFNSIESVTISTVGNSVLYGSMGIGGQINIITNDKVQNQITISPTYPIYGTDFVSLGYEFDPEWKILVNQQGILDDGYRDFNRTINNTVGLSLIRQSKVDKTKVFFNESTQWLQFPGALTLEQASADPRQASYIGSQNYNTQTIFTGIQNAHEFDSTFSSNSFITYQQMWANGDFPNSTYDSNFGQYYTQLEIKPILITDNTILGGRKLKTQWGLDGNFQTFKQTNTISNSRQNSYGVFIIPSLEVTDTLTAGIGGRYEYITTNGTFSNSQSASDAYNEYAFLAYLEQKWNQHYTSGLRVSRDYQLPFIDQSSLTPAATSTFGLQPQTSMSYSLSQKIAYDKWNVGFNAFYMDVKNQIIFDPNYIATPFNGKNINLPPTQQYGVILSGNIQPIDILNAGASITWQRNVFKNGDVVNGTDLSGDSVPGVPNYLAEAHSNLKITEPVNWYLQVLYTGSMYADGDFDNSLGKVAGYFLVNSAISYKLSSWLFSLRVNNIFNKQYNYFTTTYGDGQLYVYPAAGTNGAVMVTYEFK